MDKEAAKKRINELINVLDEASKAYYQGTDEIMSNYEYDALYNELEKLEKETGIQFASSPTLKVGYEVLSELPKERHASPMLSLDKTKEVEALKSFLGSHKALISWKLDGLTVVLTYDNGQLQKAVTRGNGEVGEVITGNAMTFKNLPHRIPYKGKLVLRGESVIGYEDFNRINEKIEDESARYKNPRNLCAGSVRQLDSRITSERNVKFYAFALVSAEKADFENSRKAQFDFLSEQGFDVVEHYFVTSDTIEERVKYFAHAISSMDLPSDGLVLTYEDLKYSESLGRTAKYPRDSFAFKWADEIAHTHLLDIEWSPSRTGLINPVAIFEPVELEGTSVSRASVHNISILKSLKLGIGDEIEVYKANMIIPQIASNLTESDTVLIPDTCPACGGKTQIRNLNGSETLYCLNEECPVKKIKSYAHFVSRDAMNMVGLSEATLEKFLSRGIIHEFSDLFDLGNHREEIESMEGFGQKSFEKLCESADKARHTSCANLIYSLGIANVGLATARLITGHCGEDIDVIRHAGAQELSDIEGVGPVIAGAFEAYWNDEDNNRAFDMLLKELILEKGPEKGDDQRFKDKTFVITGTVNHYANRNELKAQIESLGGKVAGSVSSKTDYLINNDSSSASSKNKKAHELGIPIITEEEYMELLK